MTFLMGILVPWAVLTVAFLVAAYVLPGVEVKGLGGAIFVAALFGILNALLGWLLFVVIGIVTLGLGFLLGFLTRWLVNTILLKLADALTDSLTIRGWSSAAIGALVLSVVTAVLEWLLRTALA
jgi:putative membrane protein